MYLFFYDGHFIPLLLKIVIHNFMFIEVKQGNLC